VSRSYLLSISCLRATSKSDITSIIESSTVLNILVAVSYRECHRILSKGLVTAKA
jgi:hypothetical protein